MGNHARLGCVSRAKSWKKQVRHATLATALTGRMAVPRRKIVPHSETPDLCVEINSVSSSESEMTVMSASDGGGAASFRFPSVIFGSSSLTVAEFVILPLEGWRGGLGCALVLTRWRNIMKGSSRIHSEALSMLKKGCEAKAEGRIQQIVRKRYL